MKISFLHKKVKGDVLTVVISIAVIVGVLLLGLILINSVYSKAEINFQTRNKLVLNVKSGLEYCLASSELPEEEIVDLFQEPSDSILIQSKPYGLLSRVEITAFHGSDSVGKTFILGNKSIKNTKTALYLCNSNKAIGVCGSTLLKGDVFVPERGVERVYIEGQNFIGSKLFWGEKKQSDSNLPELQPNIKTNIEAIFSATGNDPFPIEKDSIIAGKQPIILSSEEPIYLDKVVKGNVSVFSNQFIIVNSSSELDGTILRAPTIIFENGFKGSVQAFARDSIIVASDVELLYPSFLVLKALTEHNYSCKITIGEDVKMIGNILLLQEKFSLKNNGVVTIEEGSILNGTIYSEAYTQLKKCEVQGEVYTKKFYLKTPSSIYENTLLNVKIDPSKKDSNMIDLGLDKSERNWLYIK